MSRARLVDISLLNKVELLLELWERAKIYDPTTPGPSSECYPADPPEQEKCAEIVKCPCRWVAGVRLYADLSGNWVDTRDYDRMNYPGAFRDAVRSLARRSPRLKGKWRRRYK